MLEVDAVLQDTIAIVHPTSCVDRDFIWYRNLPNNHPINVTPIGACTNVNASYVYQTKACTYRPYALAYQYPSLCILNDHAMQGFGRGRRRISGCSFGSLRRCHCGARAHCISPSPTSSIPPPHPPVPLSTLQCPFPVRRAPTVPCYFPPFPAHQYESFPGHSNHSKTFSDVKLFAWPLEPLKAFPCVSSRQGSVAMGLKRKIGPISVVEWCNG